MLFKLLIGWRRHIDIDNQYYNCYINELQYGQLLELTHCLIIYCMTFLDSDTYG